MPPFLDMKDKEKYMKKQMLYDGPDISKHNGQVNIKKVRDAGAKRVGIRVGYGKGNVDQKYIVHAEACFNLNVEPLPYWFSYAYTREMSKNEALEAIKQVKKFWKTAPIAFDFEYDSVNYARKNGVAITKETATDLAIAFLREVKDAGYIPVLYTNKDYTTRYFDISEIAAQLGTVYVWYARYTSQLTEAETGLAYVWQYTSSGSWAGISGNVDLNHFYTDLKVEKTDRKPTVNLNILNFQKACNVDGILGADGKALKEDGIDGLNTQHARKNLNLKAKRVGITWKTGSTGQVVKWWQTRCNEILGHDNDTDGKFGNETRKDTIQLQKLLNLTPDGVAGYNSIQSVFYN